MSQEKDLAQKLLTAIKATQPTITTSAESITFTYQRQTTVIPLVTSQVESDRSVSFR